ncbi:MAG: DUF1259 domain-containing protein [Acidithiobacillales bacterium]
MKRRPVTTLAAALLVAFGWASRTVRGAETGWEAADKVFGAQGKDLPGGVHKYAWPRTDLHVQIGGVTLDPALALGSWGAFLRSGSGDSAMTMGDLVLLEPEVTPVVTALESSGLEVTAIHNHLLNESSRVVYLHFSGHGDAVALAKGLRAALEKTKTPLSPPKPSAPTPAEEATLRRLQEALGRTGMMAGRVLQVGVPRAESITEGGMEIPPSMGMAIGMNFQAVGDRVATTGDFVLLAGEVNPVIRELGAHGIAVTALHSHMLTESPRLFFMHFWAVNTPEKVGEGLKAALARVHTR